MAVRENKELLVELRSATVLIATLLVGTCTLSFAKKDIPSGLESALRRHYKLVSARLSDTASVVLVPGTILTVRKEGILSFPESDASFSELCPSEFQQNGSRVERQQFCARDGKLLQIQETVCVRAVDVNRPQDVVRMSVVTCDRARRSGAAYYALVTFQFPKGSFATLTAQNVEQAIDQVLSDCGAETPDTQKSTADAAAGCSDPPSRPAPAAPESPASADPSASTSANTIPTAIAQGQSPDQVIAVLGQPTSVADMGAKIIYFYPNLKIVFVDRKVSQIEQI